jgi:hypothetical protein
MKNHVYIEGKIMKLSNKPLLENEIKKIVNDNHIYVPNKIQVCQVVGNTGG